MDKQTHSVPENAPNQPLSYSRSIRYSYEQERQEYERLFERKGIIHGHIETVLGKLGEGRHSKVYQGTQPGGRVVTIKVDERDLYQDPEEIRRKIDVMRQLRHPNVAGILDFVRDEEHNRSYVIMEYTEGVGLNHALERQGPFSMAQTLNWGCQILDALSFLHKTGRIHGDIKLANIVVRDRDHSACLVDFSYLVDDPIYELMGNDPDEPEEKQNASPDIFGYYKTDRQFQIEKRKDIYRLGSVLYQLLTGVEPRKERSDEEKRQPLSDRHIDESVIRILLKALSEDPRKRYQSAETMKKDILALPRKDAARMRLIRSISRQASAIFFLLAVAVTAFFIGHYQVRRIEQKNIWTEEAQSEWANGNYSSALENIQKAVRSKLFDAPCPAKTQRVAAEMLGIYDLDEHYQPLASFSLQGQPLRAHFSPDGTRVAVLIQDSSGLQRTLLIQILDARTGESVINGALSAANSAFADFTFLNNETLFYAGLDGLSICDLSVRAQTDGTPPVSVVGLPATRIALSDDKKLLAAMNADGAMAYLYKVAPDGSLGDPQSLSFQDNEQAPSLNGDEADAATDTDGVLFALDGEGKHLAVSFSSGNLHIYRFDEPGAPSGAECFKIRTNHPYDHFEGGFCGNFFAYAAYKTIRQDASDGYSRAERKVFDLENLSVDSSGYVMETFLQNTEGLPIHAQVDENGMFFACNETHMIYQALSNGLWNAVTYTDGEIQLLRHIPGRLMALTGEHDIVLITNESGTWKVTASKGVPFDFAELSPHYLLLFRKANVSVQEWGSTIDSASIHYDEDYAHDGFYVRNDGHSVLLYRFGENLFRSYGADGELIYSNEHPDWPLVQNLTYLRDADVLEVAYPNSLKYYSAETGELVREEVLSPDATNRSIEAGEYYAQYQRSRIEVLDKRGEILYTLDAARLNDAVWCPAADTLFLSYNAEDETSGGVLLNRNMEVLAMLSGRVTALPDGSLYFDEQQGVILRTHIYTLDELLTAAENGKRGAE